MHTLRPYQQEAEDAVFDYWPKPDSGDGLIDMATGCGKSLLLCSVSQRLVRQYEGFKIIVATHVKELIEQSYSELIGIWPLAPAGIHSAGLGQRSTRHQIIFAGIQTAHRHSESFGSVDLLIVDEAHLIPRNAKTMYQKFISSLRVINPDMRILGFTATPFRLGTGRLEQGEGAIFDHVIYSYGIADGVRDGYLARLVSKATETGFDLTGVHKNGGEYVEKELQSAVDKDYITNRAVDESVAFGRDRKSWLAFCSGVDHSYHVRDAIRRRGFTAETVHGGTPPDDRRRIIEDFKAGKIRCLTNNAVLTTGSNFPRADMIMALRPTASASLYIQMMGRATRPVYPPDMPLDTVEQRLAAIAAGPKPNALVLDFAGLIRTHGPVDQVKPPGEKTGGGIAPVKECPTCHSLIHASLMECPDCGHVFPPNAVSKLTAKASALAVMGDAPAEWVRVTSRVFTMIYRPKDTALLQASFVCGQVKHRAWFMPEWGMRKGNKADKFWLEHGGKMPCPRSAVSWISRQAELAPTSEINIKPDGAKMKVLDSRAVLVMSVEEKIPAGVSDIGAFNRRREANRNLDSFIRSSKIVAAS